MPSPSELAAKFWKALRADKTVMLAGCDGVSRPMTALLDGEADEGPLWFFTAKDTELMRALGGPQEARLHFAAKGHGLFATVDGTLTADDDRAVIDRLWNPYLDAWFEGGKDDPKLQLLRFEPDEAHIWLNENSLFAGLRVMVGRDPKEDYRDKVAHIPLA